MKLIFDWQLIKLTALMIFKVHVKIKVKMEENIYIGIKETVIFSQNI